MTTPLHHTFASARERPNPEPPPPGEAGLLSAALAIGILLMAIQLWILTIALEQFERQRYTEIDALAGISALIFAGGVFMLWLLRRRPIVHRSSVPSSSTDQKRSVS